MWVDWWFDPLLKYLAVDAAKKAAGMEVAAGDWSIVWLL